MKRDIIKSNGDTYFTVKYDGRLIWITNFGPDNHTFRFDAKALDQLIDTLEEIKLVQFLGEKK